MKVYLVEQYDPILELTSIVRVCKRKEVAEALVKKFTHMGRSRLPKDFQEWSYYYSVLGTTLIE